MHETNPFIHARVVTPDEAIIRHSDVAELMRLADGGHNTTLYAPRRMGKTSLLRQLLVAAQERDLPAVLVDFSDVLSENDVAARLEQSFRALPGDVRRLIDREIAGVGLSSPVGGISVARRDRPDGLAAIHGLLELPQRIAERADRRVIVVLDEFQALLDLKGLDGVFRSHIQHHDRAAYVFSGSEPSLLRALFEDRARPLYGQAGQHRLGRLPFDPAYDFVAGRFQLTGKDGGEAVGALVHLAEGHPQRLMLLAYMLWEQVEPGEPATVSDLRRAHATAMRAVDAELRYLWDGLSTNERRVVAALASGLSPYEAESRLLTGLVSSSSAQRATEALLGRALLEHGEDERARIVDPLLAHWVRRRGAARLQVHVLPDGSGSFMVTDGPSLAFVRAEGLALDAAEAEADRIASSGQGADVIVVDSIDPNDLPEWAAGGAGG